MQENRLEDMKVQEFLSKLKETFSKSSFQQFKEAVTKYKEVWYCIIIISGQNKNKLLSES